MLPPHGDLTEQGVLRLMSDGSMLDKERDRLARQREELLQRVEEVRILLTKADARLREDPGNRKRWMGVVDNLEASLTEVRARLAGVEADLNLVEKGTPPPHVSAAAIPGPRSIPGAGAVAQTLLQMPIPQLAKLTIEELSKASGQCESGALDDETRGRAQARVELANQLRPEAPPREETELPSSRSQLALRAALSKIQTGRIDQMTEEEIQMTVSCYELMVRRVNPTPADMRLKRILSGAIFVLQKKQTEAANRAKGQGTA